MSAEAIWEECICDSLGDMNIFSSRKDVGDFMALIMPRIKAAANESKSPTQTRGSPEAKASREYYKKTKLRNKVKYLSENKIGKPNMDYIYHQLLKLYSGISDGIADGIAIEKGNKVYSVDSGRENGRISFGVRQVITISNEKLRAEYIRSRNNDTISNGNVSNELSSRIRNGLGFDWGRNLRRESGSELQADTGKSENQQSGVLAENADNRGLNGKSSRELDSLGNELSKEQKEYFKDSKVRDDNGNLLVVYHGTRKADFTVFKRNVNFFTDSSEMADSYSPNGEKFSGYLNITKPYVIDAKGERWSKIPIDQATKAFLDNSGSSTFKEGGVEEVLNQMLIFSILMV